MSKESGSEQNAPKQQRTRSIDVRGDRLRAQRLARAWTQLELARAAGLSERLVRRAEAGGPLDQSSIDAIADALNIPAEVLLLARHDSPPAPSMADNAKRFLEQIWNHGNLAVLEELTLPEFQFHHERGVASGRDETRQRVEKFRESFSDFHLVVEAVEDYGSFIICRWRVTMTHSGPWLGLPATHRRTTVFGSSWVRVVRDKFGDAWDYWDPQVLFESLASDA